MPKKYTRVDQKRKTRSFPKKEKKKEKKKNEEAFEKIAPHAAHLRSRVQHGADKRPRRHSILELRAQAEVYDLNDGYHGSVLEEAVLHLQVSVLQKEKVRKKGQRRRDRRERSETQPDRQGQRA